MLKYLILFSLFLAISLQQTTPPFCKSCLSSFTETFAVAGSNTPYRDRSVSCTTLNSPAVGIVLLSKARTKAQGEKDIDGLRIAEYVLPGFAPTFSFAYFKRVIDVTNGTNGYDFDSSTAYSFSGKKIHSVVEYNPTTGAVANTVLLRTLTWSVVDGACSSSSNISFQSITATASGTFGSFVIALTHIATNQSGVITSSAQNVNQRSLIAPKNLKLTIVLDLTKYNYANPGNQIQIITYTATGNAYRSTNLSSSNNLTPGDRNSYILSNSSGDNNEGLMIFRYANSGQLAATGKVDVNVSFATITDSSQIFASGEPITTQITRKFGTSVVITQVNITVAKPGFQDIFLYDPTGTSGPDPTTSSSLSNSSSMQSFCFGALILLISALFF